MGSGNFQFVIDRIHTYPELFSLLLFLLYLQLKFAGLCHLLLLMLHVPSLLLLLLLLASYILRLLTLLFLHFLPLLPFLLLTLKTTRGQCWDQGLMAE